jgi:hypothetical protein
MTTNNQNVIGIVIEAFDHNKHSVVTVQSNDSPKAYHFFYIAATPEVNFGDTVEMNFAEGKFYVYRGNARLTFRITPETFPGTLLMELITDHLNEEEA